MTKREFTVSDGNKKISYIAWQNGSRDNLDAIMDKMWKDFPGECYKVTFDNGFILSPSTFPFDVYWQQNVLGHLGFNLDD